MHSSSRSGRDVRARAARAWRRLARVCEPATLLLIASALSIGNARAEEAVAARSAEPAPWSARMPGESRIALRGAVRSEDAGGATGPIMYPAPGIAGFLAAVATHAVIVNSVRASRESKLQEEVDKGLAAYQDAIAGFDGRMLMRAALEKVRGPQLTAIEPGASFQGWVLESVPVFSVSADRRALVLDNSVVVFAPNAAGPTYQNLIRVVSSPEPEVTPDAGWTAEDGKHLREVTTELLAISLTVAVAAAQAPATNSQVVERTYRYAEGGVSRMERAQLVTPGCERIVVRTLRGYLMSMPVTSGSRSDQNCPATAQ
jgi:hypothetical protein